MGLYLVTGAAGFIGAALAKRLLTQGHRVISIDNLTTGYQENIPYGVESYYGNCQDSEIYKKIPSGSYDAIFHMAGQSSGEISFDNPVYDLRTNAESTLHLLKFALEVNCSRFIYASSMSVYGDGGEMPVSETAETKPKSFYAIGKLASEHYLQLYEPYGIRSTSLRFFTVYGPGQNLANLRQGMVSIYLAQMLAQNHIHVRGDANRFRDFIYIDDVIDACIACLSHPESQGKIINIASGIKTTVAELLDKLMHVYGKKVTIDYSGITQGDTFGIYANINLAKQLLNFEPAYSLNRGLELMLNWSISKMLTSA